jgi:hypothetical protein
MTRSRLIYLFISITILLGLSCKKDNIIRSKHTQSYFIGYPKLTDKLYVNTLMGKEGYTILKNQTDLYEKNYSNFKDLRSYRSANIKFEKQFLNGEKNYRIILYTLLNNTKTDSIEFFRHTAGFKYEPSNYTHISYLDLKNNKIWQLKYFSSPLDKSSYPISYEVSKIENGKIKSDHIYFLDESLDAEMDKRNLYY